MRALKVFLRNDNLKYGNWTGPRLKKKFVNNNSREPLEKMLFWSLLRFFKIADEMEITGIKYHNSRIIQDN